LGDAPSSSRSARGAWSSRLTGAGGLALVAIVAACSAQDPDSLAADAVPGGSGSGGPIDEPDGDLLQETPASGGGAGAPEHASADAAADVRPSGGNCVVGYRYCGGNKVIGDVTTLYECSGPGEPAVVERCDRGCIVNPSVADDACAPQRVDSPVAERIVTYPFGEKSSRYRLGYHTGDDYAAPVGSLAIAVRSGTIRWSNDNGGDFGRWMALDADNGRTYVYAHLDRRLNKAGDRVVAGQIIALTGNTGLSTGPHLHFEDRPLGSTDNGQAREPIW